MLDSTTLVNKDKHLGGGGENACSMYVFVLVGVQNGEMSSDNVVFSLRASGSG